MQIPAKGKDIQQEKNGCIYRVTLFHHPHLFAFIGVIRGKI